MATSVQNGILERWKAKLEVLLLGIAVTLSCEDDYYMSVKRTTAQMEAKSVRKDQIQKVEITKAVSIETETEKNTVYKAVE